jgi:hypothetical protein
MRSLRNEKLNEKFGIKIPNPVKRKSEIDQDLSDMLKDSKIQTWSGKTAFGSESFVRSFIFFTVMVRVMLRFRDRMG